MRSNRVYPVLATGLSIAAFGVAAATLSDAVVVSAKPNIASAPSLDAPVSPEMMALGILAFVAVLAAAVYTLGRRGIANKRRVVKQIPIFAALILLVLVGNHLLFGLTGLTVDLESELDRAVGHNGSDDGNNGTENRSRPEPAGEGGFFVSIALIGALVLGALAIVAAEYIPDRDADGDDSEREVDGTAASASIGRVAGNAADRIEKSDERTDNEIYRAWREMAARVDVADPQSSTPEEFAEAAVEEGLDPERVGVLTDLFEAVRYGDREVTEEREQRAVEALRAIEREHGDEE